MERNTPPWLTGRTVLRVAFVLGVMAVVAPFIITGAPGVVGAEQSYVVLSGSMADEPEPVINPGDIIIVQEANPETVEAGEVITYRTGEDTPITHRVVEVQEEGGTVQFRTKGDANEDPDGQLIGPDQVVGELMITIPLIGHVVNFANTTAGFVVLVLLPVGLLVVSEAWNMATGGAGDESSAGDGPGDGGGGSGDGGDPLAPGSQARGQQAGVAATAGTQRHDSSPSPAPQSGPTARDPVRADGATAPGSSGPAAQQAQRGPGEPARSVTGESDASEVDETGEGAMVTLERRHLLGAGVVLAAAVLGTGYAAVTLQTTWAIILCYAASGLFVLTAFLYVRMGRDDGSSVAPEGPVDASGSSATPGGAATHDPPAEATPATAGEQPRAGQPRMRTLSDWIVTGSLGVAPGNASQLDVRVEGVVPLVEMAADRGTRVVHDPDEAAYYLVGEQALFRCAEADAEVVTGDGAAAETGAGAEETPESEWRPGPGADSESEASVNGASETGTDAETSPHDGSDDPVEMDSLVERPDREGVDAADIPDPTRNGDPADVGSDAPAERDSAVTPEDDSAGDSEREETDGDGGERS